jgi:hypothetical protein
MIDVSNPASPVQLGVAKDGLNGFTALDGPQSVVLSGRTAFVASSGSGSLTIIDVGDPANPVQVGVARQGVGGFGALSGALGVSLSGTTAYVISSLSDSLTIIDVLFPPPPLGLRVAGAAEFGGAVFAPNLRSGSGVGLALTSEGEVVATTSSEQFKENIKGAVLDARKVLGLSPVTFNYRESGEVSLGYIAEQLEELGLGDLVVHGANGEPHGIAYDLIPLYHNELLKRHEAEMQKQAAEIKARDERIERLEERLRELDARFSAMEQEGGARKDEG